MTVSITRQDMDAAGLRAAAARSKDPAASRRMLALALVLEGRNRTEAARSAGMDRQTLRDWVHRYNEAGLDGLRNRANPGRPAAQADPSAGGRGCRVGAQGSVVGYEQAGALAPDRSVPVDVGSVSRQHRQAHPQPGIARAGISQAHRSAAPSCTG